jgi:hypothetical protein
LITAKAAVIEQEYVRLKRIQICLITGLFLLSPLMAKATTGPDCNAFLASIAAATPLENTQTFTALLKKMAELGALKSADIEIIAKWEGPRNPVDELGLNLRSPQETRAFRGAFAKILEANGNESVLDWNAITAMAHEIAGLQVESEVARTDSSKKTKAIYTPISLPLTGALNLKGGYDDNSVDLAADGYPIFFHNFGEKKGGIIDGKTLIRRPVTVGKRDVETYLDSRSPEKAVLIRDAMNMQVISAVTGAPIFRSPLKKLLAGTNPQEIEFHGLFGDGKGGYLILISESFKRLMVVSTATKAVKEFVADVRRNPPIVTREGRVLVTTTSRNLKKIQVVDVLSENEDVLHEITFKNKIDADGEVELIETESGKLFVLAPGKKENHLINVQTGKVHRLVLTKQIIENVGSTNVIEDPAGNPYCIVEQNTGGKRERTKLHIYDLNGGKKRTHLVPISYLDYERQYLKLRDGRTLLITIGENGKDPEMAHPKDKVYVYDIFKNEEFILDVRPTVDVSNPVKDGPTEIGFVTVFHETEDGRIEMYYRDEHAEYEVNRRRMQIFGPVND